MTKTEIKNVIEIFVKKKWQNKLKLLKQQQTTQLKQLLKLN